MSCGLYVALRARTDRRSSTQPAGEVWAGRGVGAAGSTESAEATGTRIGDASMGQATAGEDDTTLGEQGTEEQHKHSCLPGHHDGHANKGPAGPHQQAKAQQSAQGQTYEDVTVTRRAAKARDNRRWSTSSRSCNRELRWGKPHGSDKLLIDEIAP